VRSREQRCNVFLYNLIKIFGTTWAQDRISQNFLSNFSNLEIIKAKEILKQISLKGDINYCNNHKLPIFDG
jgi:hypothetical protein